MTKEEIEIKLKTEGLTKPLIRGFSGRGVGGLHGQYVNRVALTQPLPQGEYYVIIDNKVLVLHLTGLWSKDEHIENSYEHELFEDYQKISQKLNWRKTTGRELLSQLKLK